MRNPLARPPTCLDELPGGPGGSLMALPALIPPQPIYCSGRAHAELGRSVPLDLRAKTGPSRVALIEDGATFCGSCAHELNRVAADGS